MPSTSELGELLVLLKEHGVSKYSCGDLHVEFGGGGSIQVINHGAHESEPKPPKPANVDPALKAAFERLNPIYQKAFQLGE